MHIHFFERGCPETAGVVGTEGQPGEFVNEGKAPGEGLHGRSREIVVAKATHSVESRRDVPIELGIAIDIALSVVGTFYELIGGEIIVQIVSS